MAETVKLRRRREVACVCGRIRHRTCSVCGQTKLIGWKDKKGLYDHITMELHGCNGDSSWEDEGDNGPGGQSTGAAQGGETLGGAGTGGGQQGQQSKNRGSQGNESGKGNGNPLAGKNIAITGALENMSRMEAMSAIQQAGGNYQNVVRDTTDLLLVSNKSAESLKQSGKMRAAEQNGTQILSEDEFNDIINGKQQNNNGQMPSGENMDNMTPDELLDALVDALSQKREDLLGFDPSNFEKKMEDLAKEALETAKSTQQVEIKINDIKTGETKTVAGAHEQTPLLIKLMDIRENVMLVGPAGSGKTKGVELAADALGLSFYPKSVGPTTTEFAMMGYMDANGNYIPGIMREPFENGGVLLIDEIDAGNPACLTALNTALANEYCSFPDGVVQRHPDFVAVASANTFGRGADRQYVGRSQMDAATLDRFIKVPWEYDKVLEQGIITSMIAQSGNQDLQQWLSKVWQLRAAAESKQLRVIIGTRAVISGARLILAGFGLAEVEQLRIWNGVDDEMREQILAAAR